MNVGKSWPEGTFVRESEEEEHYCGSHWDPFFDSPDGVLEALPDIIPELVPLRTFGDTYSGPHDIPAGWTTGEHFCWPNANQGLVATLRETGNDLELTNVCPFAGVGIQAGIEVEKIHVWTSGAEAQIEGVWGEAQVSFFDLAFLGNRAWYEAGGRRQFILAGIAYEAGASKVDTLAVAPDSPLANWQRTHAGIAERESAYVCLQGSGIFLPIADWDRDDYRFRGPIRSVAAFDDWLGQSGWKVRVAVMQFEDESAELDVFVTGRAWRGSEPPCVSQDIEGTLWLQGRLWSAA